VYESKSNSISVRFNESNAIEFCKKCLKDEMILVKCFSSKESLNADCIRFSIKERNLNEKILLLLKEFLGQ
jgi:histidinol-phosphate/aromatic aminotransferase/cobyric acid decarboxylase-like protein